MKPRARSLCQSNQTRKPTKKQEEERHLGVVADELDSMAGVDGGAEPALLQPHGASFLGTVLRAPNRQNKRVW